MSDLSQLKIDAQGLSVLYVEDNRALRENASTLLSKIFDTVLSAEDGAKGLKIYEEFHPDIVITDIKMPNMTGLELATHIRKISQDTKIMIMSAFDDKENLHKGIDIGISGFLTKPVAMPQLFKGLNKVVTEITNENNKNLFLTHIKNIFNYQSSMVMMINDTKPIIANQILLDFFKVADLKEFIAKYSDLGTLFLEHDGFLFNTNERNWFNEVKVNEQKLYHIKMKNLKDEFRHFILKYQKIPDKENYGVISLNDITELNLLKLFDENQTDYDGKEQDTTALFKLLEVIKNNTGKVQLHDYYKGLSITNDAVIVEIKENSIVLKTSFLQEKAAQFEKKTIMTSEALPYAVECSKIIKIGFESQQIEFKNIRFVKTSAVQRKTVRIVPEENTKVSLFISQNRYQGELFIEDISLEALKLNLKSFPAGLKDGDKVIIDMVFDLSTKPIPLNVHARMAVKSENKNSFSIIFMFELEPGEKSILVKYITKREMNIIKEFKGLQNG